MKLEEYVISKFQEVYPEARETPGSGNTLDDADVRMPHWVIECKDTNTKENIIVTQKWIEKVRQQAYSREKEWAIVNSNKNGEKVITLDLEIFIEVLLGEYPSE